MMIQGRFILRKNFKKLKKLDEIIFYGRLIENYGLISSHAGNISVRIGDNILITKSGTMLGHLRKNDITVVSLKRANDFNLKYASMETIVHKSIYINSNAKAVIHTHPEFLISISNFLDKFSPLDSEGKFIFKEIPVIKVSKTIASSEVAENIGEISNKYNAAVVKDHGLFVWSDSIEKSFYLTTSIEKSAKIIYYSLQWKKEKN